mmetsp:Transcript_5583/g.16610  ORF Transcript_5583/g.16610 Transcript_5583/m.16610 type:complete len:109 (+) Transcript_5583:505-831(+)
MLPSCEGTVTLVDASVTVFKRIWCLLENHVSEVLTEKRGKPHLVDLAAWSPHGTFCDHDKKEASPEEAVLKKDNGDGTWTDGLRFPRRLRKLATTPTSRRRKQAGRRT